MPASQEGGTSPTSLPSQSRDRFPSQVFSDAKKNRLPARSPSKPRTARPRQTSSATTRPPPARYGDWACWTPRWRRRTSSRPSGSRTRRSTRQTMRGRGGRELLCIPNQTNLKCRPQRIRSDANARIFNHFLFRLISCTVCAIIAGIQRYHRLSCHHKQSWRPCAPYGKTCSRKVYRCTCTRNAIHPHITRLQFSNL